MTLENIKIIINDWDPIGLLDHAPQDEYDIESEEIFLYLGKDEKRNGAIIHSIFKKAFGSTFTKSIDDCILIAKKIEELK